MNIIVVGMKYDYDDSSRELSYGFINFYKTLESLGHNVKFFDFYHKFKKDGKALMNKELEELVNNFKPYFVLFSLHQDEFFPSTLKNISSKTISFSFFCDDTWRREYTDYWSSFFSVTNTPNQFDISAPKLSTKKISFPFGFNENIYKRKKINTNYDVSFIGSWHPHREWVINKLKKKGFMVYTAGYGWPEGQVSASEMVTIFNSSSINLNLSNSSSWDIRYLFSGPRAIFNTLRSQKNVEQIKARHFEISACGGFQISYFADGLNKFYEIEDEIVIFNNIDDLINKVQFFLDNTNERLRISNNAYRRAIKEHSYQKRFTDFIKTIS